MTMMMKRQIPRKTQTVFFLKVLGSIILIISHHVSHPSSCPFAHHFIRSINFLRRILTSSSAQSVVATCSLVTSVISFATHVPTFAIIIRPIIVISTSSIISCCVFSTQLTSKSSLYLVRSASRPVLIGCWFLFLAVVYSPLVTASWTHPLGARCHVL